MNIRSNKNNLEEGSTTDLSTIHKDELKDISMLQIDTTLSIQQRLTNFLKEIYDPYCFFVESSVVEIEFSESGYSLETLLKIHFIEQIRHTKK